MGWRSRHRILDRSGGRNRGGVDDSIDELALAVTIGSKGSDLSGVNRQLPIASEPLNGANQLAVKIKGIIETAGSMIVTEYVQG